MENGSKALESEDIREITNIICSGGLINTLKVLRMPILKLSETNITKHSFFQWKNAKYLDALFPASIDEINNPDKKKTKGWNKFSILDLTILSIVNILWERNLDYKIKEFVELFLLGDDFDKQIKMFVNEDSKIIEEAFLKNNESTLLNYMFMQKKESPHLPFISNIEGLIIATFKLNKPHSIIIYEDDTIEFLITSSFMDVLNRINYREMLEKTFLNISIKEIVENIIYGKYRQSTIGKQNNLIDKLINIGYDNITIKEIFENKNQIYFEEEKIDVKKNLESVFLENRNDDQDIILKVRSGEKVSLRRIVIKQKK